VNGLSNVAGRDRQSDSTDSFRCSNTYTNDRISRNFQVYELIKSDIALRRGIDNRLTADTRLRAAIELTRNVLQPIRNHFGAYTPNSVYRSQAVERVLKNKPSTWYSKSQHTTGQAADIEVLTASNAALAKWISENLVWDQLILEMYTPGEPNSGWVHVSYNMAMLANRKKVLTFDGKTYRSGLIF